MRQVSPHQTTAPRTMPPGGLTRPPEPMPRRDPAPSRWRYRLSRLMLTPVFRSFLRVGLPAFLVLFVVGAWFSSAENRQKLTDVVADVRSQIEQRPEFAVKMMAIEGAAMAGGMGLACCGDYVIAAADAQFGLSETRIGLTPAQIVNAALEESAHVVGLSILSGSHLPLVKEVIDRMKAAGLDDVPVVAGGIIPETDAEELRAYGVARVYTPKDFELNRIMTDIVALVGAGAEEPADRGGF